MFASNLTPFSFSLVTRDTRPFNLSGFKIGLVKNPSSILSEILLKNNNCGTSCTFSTLAADRTSEPISLTLSKSIVLKPPCITDIDMNSSFTSPTFLPSGILPNFLSCSVNTLLMVYIVPSLSCLLFTNKLFSNCSINLV